MKIAWRTALRCAYTSCCPTISPRQKSLIFVFNSAINCEFCWYVGMDWFQSIDAFLASIQSVVSQICLNCSSHLIFLSLASSSWTFRDKSGIRDLYLSTNDRTNPPTSGLGVLTKAMQLFGCQPFRSGRDTILCTMHQRMEATQRVLSSHRIRFFYRLQ